MKYIPKSTFMFCRNDHLVAITTENIGFTQSYIDSYEFMPGQKMSKKCSYCDADWFFLSLKDFIE